MGSERHASKHASGRRRLLEVRGALPGVTQQLFASDVFLDRPKISPQISCNIPAAADELVREPDLSVEPSLAGT